MTKGINNRWVKRVLDLRDRIDFRKDSTFRRLIIECRKLCNGSVNKLIGNCHTSKERGRLAEAFFICATFNPSILSKIGGFIMKEYRLSELELHENVLTSIFIVERLGSKSLIYVLGHFKGKTRDLHVLSVKIFYQVLYGRSIVSKPALAKLKLMRKDIDKSIDELRGCRASPRKRLTRKV